jgi:hypothetical protein
MDALYEDMYRYGISLNSSYSEKWFTQNSSSKSNQTFYIQ